MMIDLFVLCIVCVTCIVMPVFLAMLRLRRERPSWRTILATTRQVSTLGLAGVSSHSGYSRVTTPELWLMMLQLDKLGRKQCYEYILIVDFHYLPEGS